MITISCKSLLEKFKFSQKDAQTDAHEHNDMFNFEKVRFVMSWIKVGAFQLTQDTF